MAGPPDDLDALLGINGRLLFETQHQVESFLVSDRPDPIPTHVLPFMDLVGAFERVQSGPAISVIPRRGTS